MGLSVHTSDAQPLPPLGGDLSENQKVVGRYLDRSASKLPKPPKRGHNPGEGGDIRDLLQEKRQQKELT